MKKTFTILLLFGFGFLQSYGYCRYTNRSSMSLLEDMRGFTDVLNTPVNLERYGLRDRNIRIIDHHLDTSTINKAYVEFKHGSDFEPWVHYLCRPEPKKRFSGLSYYFIKYEDRDSIKVVHYRDNRSLAKMSCTYRDDRLEKINCWLSDILMLSYAVDSTGLRNSTYTNNVFELEQLVEMMILLDTHYNVHPIPYMYRDTFYVDNMTYDILEKESPRMRMFRMTDSVTVQNRDLEDVTLSYREYIKRTAENKLTGTAVQINPTIHTLPDDYPLLMMEVKHRNFSQNGLLRYFILSPQTQEVLMIILRQTKSYKCPVDSLQKKFLDEYDIDLSRRSGINVGRINSSDGICVDLYNDENHPIYGYMFDDETKMRDDRFIYMFDGTYQDYLRLMTTDNYKEYTAYKSEKLIEKLDDTELFKVEVDGDTMQCDARGDIIYFYVDAKTLQTILITTFMSATWWRGHMMYY